MSLQEERMRILKMVQEGKLSAEEGANLMEILETPSSGEESTAKKINPETGNSYDSSPRNIVIKVIETDTGRDKVNLKIPLGVSKMLKSLIPQKEKDKLFSQGIDLEVLLSEKGTREKGIILDVVNEDDGEQVIISLE